MHKLTTQALAYVQDAMVFFFLDASIVPFLERIYLFGSAARGELTEESDIDVFIDCSPEKAEKVELAAKAAIGRFYQSNDFEKWKRLQFTYPIAVHAGALQEWQLYTSIQADGILLYAKNPALPFEERGILFTFEFPTAKKKYIHFIRELFGRKEKQYVEHGLLKEVRGKKLDSKVILVPREHLRRMLDFFHKEKINYRMKEIGIASW